MSIDIPCSPEIPESEMLHGFTPSWAELTFCLWAYGIVCDCHSPYPNQEDKIHRTISPVYYGVVQIWFKVYGRLHSFAWGWRREQTIPTSGTGSAKCKNISLMEICDQCRALGYYFIFRCFGFNFSKRTIWIYNEFICYWLENRFQ